MTQEWESQEVGITGGHFRVYLPHYLLNKCQILLNPMLKDGTGQESFLSCSFSLAQCEIYLFFSPQRPSDTLSPAWSASLCGLPQVLRIHSREVTHTQPRPFKNLQPEDHHSELILYTPGSLELMSCILFILCWKRCS